ncbi:MAG: hypothetical protein AABY07_00275 [Nanoarchaeota archaeon]
MKLLQALKYLAILMEILEKATLVATGQPADGEVKFYWKGKKIHLKFQLEQTNEHE